MRGSVPCRRACSTEARHAGPGSGRGADSASQKPRAILSFLSTLSCHRDLLAGAVQAQSPTRVAVDLKLVSRPPWVSELSAPAVKLASPDPWVGWREGHTLHTSRGIRPAGRHQRLLLLPCPTPACPLAGGSTKDE